MSFVKYILIAKNTLQEYFVYRVNFIFWRLQVFISFLIFYSLWSAVGQSRGYVGSYSLPQLYSYFIIGYIIRALVFTTRTADIGGDIQQGNISILFLKPISTIKYYFSRDVIDKLFNLFFMIFEFSFILIIYRPPLVLPDFRNILFSIFSLFIAIILFFFYSLLISFTTFWVDSAWSTRFLFGVVFVNLFSGQFIPLDLLPPLVGQILSYTPFPYMYYYPVKIWLGQVSLNTSLFYLSSGLIVTLLFYFISQFVWLKGKKKYQSYGN